MSRLLACLARAQFYNTFLKGKAKPSAFASLVSPF